MARYFTRDQLETLRELRATFLGFEDESGGGFPSYWRALEELELYDATFAQRIGWDLFAEPQSRERWALKARFRKLTCAFLPHLDPVLGYRSDAIAPLRGQCSRSRGVARVSAGGAAPAR